MAKTQEVKTKRPGLYESKGEVVSEFQAYDKGNYYVEVDSFEEKQTQNGNEMHVAKMIILNAEKEQADGRNVEGMPIFHNMVIQDPDHQYYQLGIDQLKNFLNAAGVKVNKEGLFDHKKAVGSKFWVELGKVNRKDEDGKKIPDKWQNTVRDCFIDDEDDDV